MKEVTELCLLRKNIIGNYGEKFSEIFYEPLLEYVAIIAEEYHPATLEDREYGQYMSKSINDFAFRYIDDRVDKSSYQKYLENTEVLQTIEALGYDVNKFWYLLMFILDFSIGLCRFGKKMNDSPKEQIAKVVNAIIENIDSFENYSGDPIFKNPAQLVLKIPKKKLIIDNQIALTWLAAILKDELEKIESGSKMATSITKLNTINGNFESDPISDAVNIWYFAKMFIKFFEFNPPIKAKLKKGSPISYNKLLLISRLIFITELSGNENFLESDDTLKGYLNKYKHFKINMVNGRYL